MNKICNITKKVGHGITLPTPVLKQIIQQYVDGVPSTDIARKHGIHPSTVIEIMHHYNIPVNHPGTGPRSRTPYVSAKKIRKGVTKPEDMSPYIKRYLAGEKHAKIVADIGCTAGTFYRWLAEEGVSRKNIGSILEEKTKKIAVLIEQGVSKKDIADIIGIKIGSLYNIISKMNKLPQFNQR